MAFKLKHMLSTPVMNVENDSIAASKAWKNFKAGYMNRKTHPATGKPITAEENLAEYNREKNEFYYDTERNKLRFIPTDDGEIPIQGFKENLKDWQLPPATDTPLEKGRCWDGYEPVPGKKAYSEGSCRKIGSNSPATHRMRRKHFHAKPGETTTEFRNRISGPGRPDAKWKKKSKK